MEKKVKPNHFDTGGREDVLSALALGSSVALCLYDPIKGVGGMAYALFPDSSKGTEREPEPMKYVDTALKVLLKEMEKLGATRSAIWAKLVGGAKIFRFYKREENGDIGKLNVDSARKQLEALNIPVKAEDTGDSFGRTVRFYLEDGRIEVEAVNKYKYFV